MHDTTQKLNLFGTLKNRWHIRRAARARVPTEFIGQPEPRSMGDMARGRQLVAGNVLCTGHLLELGGKTPWSMPMPSGLFQDEMHGFTWLDDLAALGTEDARQTANLWVQDWITKFGRGTGAGWRADLTGRRLVRWINHALLILAVSDKTQGDRFFASLSHQTVYLSRVWAQSPLGIGRFEALSGVIYAGLALKRLDYVVEPALAAFASECDAQIDASGGIPTRNPEELLEVFTLCTWISQGLTEVRMDVPDEIRTAMARMAPTLRSLKHNDGSLARFHGGGRGLPGQLDQALAASQVVAVSSGEFGMGFGRISAGSTTLVLDGAAPPTGDASLGAHASTAAMELCSGRHPILVSCGSGKNFDDEWRLAGRATPSHSALVLDGVSSSRFASSGPGARRQLMDVPSDVQAEYTRAIDGTRLKVAHDGYRKTHGLIVTRTIDMTLDGRAVVGEDHLSPQTDADRARFDDVQLGAIEPTRIHVRFHVHPDVEAALDLGGTAVSLTLPNGDVWVYRHDGKSTLSLEPSVYLEQRRVHPRATDQIVLTRYTDGVDTKIRWSLAKAKERS